VARRIKSLKNCSDPIGNRTHDLLACSAVPEPAHIIIIIIIINLVIDFNREIQQLKQEKHTNTSWD
jgi:hypothetical protein